MSAFGPRSGRPSAPDRPQRRCVRLRPTNSTPRKVALASRAAGRIFWRIPIVLALRSSPSRLEPPPKKPGSFYRIRHRRSPRSAALPFATCIKHHAPAGAAVAPFQLAVNTTLTETMMFRRSAFLACVAASAA